MNQLERNFNSHKVNEKQRVNMELTRIKAQELAEFALNNYPRGQERDIALIKLEEFVFWANAGISRPKLTPEVVSEYC